MGLKTAFIGRVAGDPLGLSYAEQTEAQGTVFVNPTRRWRASATDLALDHFRHAGR